jgi:hypothetical protein
MLPPSGAVDSQYAESLCSATIQLEVLLFRVLNDFGAAKDDVQFVILHVQYILFWSVENWFLQAMSTCAWTAAVHTLMWGVDSPVSMASLTTQLPESNNMSAGAMHSALSLPMEQMSPGSSS